MPKYVGYRVEDCGHDSPCWLWQGYLDRDGYAKSNGERVYRRMYIERVGEVPGGLELDHLCRTRACVNPDHLEPVTKAENARRAPRTKLTPETVHAIRASTASIRELARRFNIGKSTVHRVRCGEDWADV